MRPAVLCYPGHESPEPATAVSALPNLHAKIAQLADGLEIVATRRLGNRDDARDAAQETIARLLERVHAGAIGSDDEIVPVAWGIARHVIADMLRGRARGEAVLCDVASDSPGPLDQLVSADEVSAVRSALSRLSDDDRALLHRCFVLGERIGRIAEDLGEPAERLRKRKSRALQRLAALLPARGDSASHENSASPMEQA